MTENKYVGPNTAGLAQRFRKDYEQRDDLNVLKRNYIQPCNVNQY